MHRDVSIIAAGLLTLALALTGTAAELSLEGRWRGYILQSREAQEWIDTLLRQAQANPHEAQGYYDAARARVLQRRGQVSQAIGEVRADPQLTASERASLLAYLTQEQRALDAQYQHVRLQVGR